MDHIARPQLRHIQNTDHLQDQSHHGHDFQRFIDPRPIQSHQLTIQETLFQHFKINIQYLYQLDGSMGTGRIRSFMVLVLPGLGLFISVILYDGIDTVGNIIGEKSQ